MSEQLSQKALFLNPALQFISAKELPIEFVKELEIAPDEFLLKMEGTRQRLKVVGSDVRDFILQFHKPLKIADAILLYSKSKQTAAEKLLNEVFPVLKSLVACEGLVFEGEYNPKIPQSLSVGDKIGNDYEVVRRVRVLDDCQVYQVKDSSGRQLALKRVTLERKREVAGLAHEASVLSHLQGLPVPLFLAQDQDQDFSFLVMEWIDGVPIERAAADLRASRSFLELRRLCSGLPLSPSSNSEASFMVTFIQAIS